MSRREHFHKGYKLTVDNGVHHVHDPEGNHIHEIHWGTQPSEEDANNHFVGLAEDHIKEVEQDKEMNALFGRNDA